MAQLLLQKVLNCEIKTEDLLTWLIVNPKEKSNENLSTLCSQKDFVAYFLNVLHAQLLNCSERSVETPQKPKLLNTTSSVQNRSSKLHKRNLFNDSRSNDHIDKSKSIDKSHFDDSSQSFSNYCSSSTPKNSKSLSYVHADESFSPISYNKAQNSFKREVDNTRNSTVCLGDYMVFSKKNPNNNNNNARKKLNKSLGESQKNVSKRINPTKVNEKRKQNDFINCDNSFNFKQSKDQLLTLGNGEVTRDNLRKEIEIFNTKRNSVDESFVLDQIKTTSEVKISNSNIEISPNPKLVTFRDKLKDIVAIYGKLLDNNVVLNVIGELYFVISLLFNKCYNCSELLSMDEILSSGDDNLVTFEELFKSVHNVIFFACRMLENFDSTLRTLDRLTLKYLSENVRLRLFLPEFTQKLENYYENKTEKLTNVYGTSEKRNICFVLDTDNRSNFPSDISFQSFKKQRDLFYEILKIWEDEHMRHDWNFQAVLGRKIKLLLDYHNDPFNFMRLSRLFTDQLLSNCVGKNTTTEKGENETDSSLLTSFPSIDKDKFDRLKNRLITKQSSDGINIGLDFSGYQEFYKEFILTSSNPYFFRHLCDNFVSEISELNRTTFSNVDSESTDNETDHNTRKAFVVCLKSLRILAKFLGFVEALPYKTITSTSSSSNLLDFQIKIRDQVNPYFDVRQLLKDSSQKGTLTLFVPWLCVYLSMLDQITLKTRYYVEITNELIKLYGNFEKSGNSIPKYNVSLVKYTLGWFFELKNNNNISQSSFYEKVTRNNYSKNRKNEEVMSLDKLDIVDQNILYMFCPFLEEIKKLLASKIVMRDRVTVRHITPLTAVESPEEVARKKIENQLEEAFFNGHPASLKKTVDFVSERIASICVKYLCYKIVPDFKRQFVRELKEKIQGSIDNEELIVLRKKCDKMAEENFRTLENLWTLEVDNIIENNLKTAIHSLLPIDSLPQVETICLNVAKKTCLEKVKQWSSTHIVLSILTKDVATEIARYVNNVDVQKSKAKHAFALPPGGNNGICHDETVKSAVYVLDKLRDMSVALLSTVKDLDESDLIQFLSVIQETLTRRNDVNEAIHFVILSQLVDFCLLLITFQTSTFSRVQKIFVDICKIKGDRNEELFSNLVSLRNVTILAQAGPVSKDCWREMANFCVIVLKEGLLSCENFESQCVGIFKNDLSAENVENITNFMGVFVEMYKNECKSSKFTFLLEFLSDYCSDL